MTDVQQSAITVRNALRQKCRTDLLALCKVLGYMDVCREVHSPILDALQKFPGGEDIEVSPGRWEYRPFVPHWRLEGPRDDLILYPRGHLKTTIISISHSIQWIINYPDIRICISTAIGDQMELVLGSLLKQFRFNENFRALFPDLCPQAEKAADWGNKAEFMIPGRKDLTLKEPTVWTCSVGKVNASFRADVTKHSDLVNEINVKTPGGINEVIEHFGHFEPIVERYNARDVCEMCGKIIRHPEHLQFNELPPVGTCCDQTMKRYKSSHGWTDVEGTRYDFGDLYGIILKDPNFNKVVKSAIGDDGKPLWPSRFPLEELERIRVKPTVGDWIFSAQYLNKCIPTGDGLCDPKDIAFIPADVMASLIPRLRLHVTIDLHGMEQAKSNDWTVMTLGGFDRDGRLYVPEIKMGRFTPEEIIANIFDFHYRYPQIIDFKIEKDAHARVLLPFLKREREKRQRFPTIWPIPRDNQRSKKDRIRGLRPWFKTKIILFSMAIPLNVKQELLEEVAQFPSESAGVHDDILDTLADQMQNAEGGVNDDVLPDAPDMKTALFGLPRPKPRFMGFDETGNGMWSDGYSDGPQAAERYSPTGIM